ncbi:MAG: thioredoxin domain-containing protein [Alphaproteobacteria bacterium]|nr:thioredoxin domain-containing protein [Alphaproteobacteria bacterium]
MDKFIKTLSTIITSILFYVIASYVYLSSKGFVYENGTFILVKEAYASTQNEPLQFANKIGADVALNFNADKAIGDKNAPLTLFEFSSLGCSHCADFHLNILPKLEKDFISTGKLKVVFVNFPLDAKSMKGAMLSECVSSENKSDFINKAFLKQREWMLSFKSEEVLAKYAINESFKQEDAVSCLSDDALAQKIIADRQEAIDKLNIQGTPAFLFSDKDANEIVYGVPEYEQLKSYIQSRLEK